MYELDWTYNMPIHIYRLKENDHIQNVMAKDGSPPPVKAVKLHTTVNTVAQLASGD